MRILLFIFILLLAHNAKPQSFYANKFSKTGRLTQINGKTVMQKKQLGVYQKRSLLYKIKRSASYGRKRKKFK